MCSCGFLAVIPICLLLHKMSTSKNLAYLHTLIANSVQKCNVLLNQAHAGMSFFEIALFLWNLIHNKNHFLLSILFPSK